MRKFHETVNFEWATIYRKEIDKLDGIFPTKYQAQVYADAMNRGNCNIKEPLYIVISIRTY